MNTYAYQLGREWGVGQEGKNNGIVFLWATEDREVYIATGYGLEGALPDGISKRILEQEVLPAFRQSQWYQGLDKGTAAVIKYANGEYDAEPKADGEFPIWAFVIMLIIIYFVFRSVRAPAFAPYLLRRWNYGVFGINGSEDTHPSAQW